MNLVRSSILVASILLLFIGLNCSKSKAFQTMKMPSGNQYKVIGVGVVQSPLIGGNPAFTFAYESARDLSDNSSIQSEIAELQSYLVLNASNRNLNYAILEVHDSPSKFLGISKNIDFIYERNSDGSWHRSGDSAIVPLAKPILLKTGD